jgi:hypothetical protein
LEEIYSFRKHTITKGVLASRDGTESLKRLNEGLAWSSVRYAATGLAGAWLHRPFAEFRLTTFCVDRVDDALLQQLGVRPESRGSNVWLVMPNDQGVYDGVSTIQGCPAVDAVQVYLDLQQHPERASEAADELRRREIFPGQP